MFADLGTVDATIVLVADTLTRGEVAHGQRGLGPSAGRLQLWWEAVGIVSADIYWTSVLSVSAARMERVAWEAEFSALRERLERLTAPRVIVPLGDYALYALKIGRAHV